MTLSTLTKQTQEFCMEKKENVMQWPSETPDLDQTKYLIC